MTPRQKYDLPIKVTHNDLKRLGIVTSRYDQFQKIKAGRLPPPQKDDPGKMQARAWWWGDDIAEHLDREREAAS